MKLNGGEIHMFKKKIFILAATAVLCGIVGCGEAKQYEDTVQQEESGTEENPLTDSNELELVEETEQVEAVTRADVIEDVDDGIIRFREIKWYSTKKDVENYLFETGAENGGWMSSDSDIYRMSGIDYTNVTMGEDRVEGGGCKGWYSGVSVAGYEASDTYACYIFSINDDGSIEMSEDDAQFYFGWYTFTQEDYSDIAAIYDDLKTKLCTLYGEGLANKTDYHTTMTWMDAENNQVRLLMNNDFTYITLGYMAAGAEERLDEMQVVLDKIESQNEAEERENNKDNVSGL